MLTRSLISGRPFILASTLVMIALGLAVLLSYELRPMFVARRIAIDVENISLGATQEVQFLAGTSSLQSYRSSSKAHANGRSSETVRFIVTGHSLLKTSFSSSVEFVDGVAVRKDLGMVSACCAVDVTQSFLDKAGPDLSRAFATQTKTSSHEVHFYVAGSVDGKTRARRVRVLFQLLDAYEKVLLDPSSAATCRRIIECEQARR